MGPTSYSSQALEALCVPLLLETFPDLVRDSNLVVFTDNTPYKIIYDTPSKPRGAFAADILAVTAQQQIRLNCHVSLQYVPTDYNIADPVSRLNWQVFKDVTSSSKLSAAASMTKPSLPDIPCCSTAWPNA